FAAPAGDDAASTDTLDAQPSSTGPNSIKTMHRIVRFIRFNIRSPLQAGCSVLKRDKSIFFLCKKPLGFPQAAFISS
ncbi:MAG: hypothetical protein ABIO88_02065, partial [Burkholderiaceae bacterium]